MKVCAINTLFLFYDYLQFPSRLSTREFNFERISKATSSVSTNQKDELTVSRNTEGFKLYRSAFNSAIRLESSFQNMCGSALFLLRTSFVSWIELP